MFKAMQLAKLKAVVGKALVLMATTCACGMLTSPHSGREAGLKPPAAGAGGDVGKGEGRQGT
jgi:hypothetical protein